MEQNLKKIKEHYYNELVTLDGLFKNIAIILEQILPKKNYTTLKNKQQKIHNKLEVMIEWVMFIAILLKKDDVFDKVYIDIDKTLLEYKKFIEKTKNKHIGKILILQKSY